MYRRTLLLSGFLVFVVGGGAFAAELSATGTPMQAVKKKVPVTVQPRTDTPVMSLATKPLKAVLKRNMIAVKPLSACVTVPNALERLFQKDREVSAAFQAAGLEYDGIAGGLLKTHLLPSIEKYCCSDNASFSVQQQQAAGCSGNDTVDECMEKLAKACIHRIGGSYQSSLQKKQKEISAVSKSTGQLDEKLQQLMQAIP